MSIELRSQYNHAAASIAAPPGTVTSGLHRGQVAAPAAAAAATSVRKLSNESNTLSARNLLAVATAGSPRLTSERGAAAVATRNALELRPRSPGATAATAAAAAAAAATSGRSLSPEILLDAKLMRGASTSRNGSAASMYTNSVNLTVPVTASTAVFGSGGGGVLANGDVNSMELSASYPGHGDSVGSSSSCKPRIGLSCIKSTICSTFVKKCLWGVVMMSVVTFSWLGATQLLKATFTGEMRHLIQFGNFSSWTHLAERANKSEGVEQEHHNSSSSQNSTMVSFNAPFLTTWLCSLATVLFLPLYLVCQLLAGTNKASLVAILRDSVQNLREKGFTLGKFLGRCCLFSMLWILTNYLYIFSLKILGCTEVIALFATNVSFIYLLSWVVLHEQFVGLRIVAVILSNTGIALLAYMDGINQTPTLGGVVLGAAAAAGSAVYKVLFKRTMGDVSFCQVSMFFSTIGLCTTFIFWPLMLALVLTGAESFNWDRLPWISLTGAVFLTFVANLLANFGIVVTYETFITVGLIMAVPASAAIDIYVYGATFTGMKLAGIILISSGFIVVLLPSNWPNVISRLISWGRRRNQRDGENARRQPPDLRTGHIGSRLRSPSGRVK